MIKCNAAIDVRVGKTLVGHNSAYVDKFITFMNVTSIVYSKRNMGTQVLWNP